MKIRVWATDKEGNGRVQDIGTFDDLYEVQIHIGHFAPDVVITIEEVRDDKED